jgi:uncharacterized protein YbjT (DUF2867 family)
MHMRIAINTPNGNIGRRLTQQLLDAGASVSLLARDASKVADFAARGARVVEGSVEDPKALSSLLEGADRLFWLSPPAFRPDLGAWMQRVVQGAAAAIKERGLRRLVVLSSAGAHSGPGTGPVGHLLAVENTLRAAAPDVVILRPGFFMENLLRDLPSILRDGAIYSPNPTDKQVPMVATADIAARAASFLLDATWQGQRTLGVYGPADLSYRQAASILSQALGRPVRHVETTLEQTRQGMLSAGVPDFVAAGYIEMYEAIRAGRMDYVDPRTHESISPTTLDSFARETLLPALRAASGAGPALDASLIARVNEIMTAWELGDTELYRSRCAPGVRMSIPAYQLEIQGFDSIWGVRASMKPLSEGPLDIHTLDSHSVSGRTVSANSHVISRANGQFTQHASVRFVFDELDRLVHYHQDLIWRQG